MDLKEQIDRAFYFYSKNVKDPKEAVKHLVCVISRTSSASLPCEYVISGNLEIKVTADEYLAESVEALVMTRDYYFYQVKRNTLFHRLATNGEWLAMGKKTKKERLKVLREEAEGFADMCSGYDRIWEQILEEYIVLNPKHTDNPISYVKFDSDLACIPD